MAKHWRFLRNFIRHPLSVGAIAPSSRWLARKMTEGVDLEKAGTVVELGPGTGSFTGAIERALSPDAVFLALEVEEDFVRDLRSRDLGRCEVIHDSAENIAAHLASHGRDAADVVLSGLPWASFPSDLQERILSAVVDALAPGGRFATFAYLHALPLPTARRFREVLESRFASVERSPAEWRNLPPACIYRCRK